MATQTLKSTTDVDILKKVFDTYRKVVQNYQNKKKEEEIDINKTEYVREMFVKLSEKHLQSIKDRLRLTTQIQQPEPEEDEERSSTMAQKLSGCTGFATFIMAEYIQQKNYEHSIYKFPVIFNTYPGSLIYGITQQDIESHPNYTGYTYTHVGLKPALEPGLNLLQVCTKSLSDSEAFGYFPVHTFLVFNDNNQLHLASSWFSGEFENPHTPPTLTKLTKTDATSLQELLEKLVTSPEEELNVLVKYFFGDANSFNFGKEGNKRTFEVFVFDEEFFKTQLELVGKSSVGYRKMKKRKRKSTLKRRKRHSTKRKKRNQIKKRTKKRYSK